MDDGHNGFQSVSWRYTQGRNVTHDSRPTGKEKARQYLLLGGERCLERAFCVQRANVQIPQRAFREDTMLDKFKRYRIRQKEGRIGVGLDVKVFLRRATGLPSNATYVSARLVKGRRTTKFDDGTIQKGTLAFRLQIRALACFLVTNPSLCTEAESIHFQGLPFGESLLSLAAQSTETLCKLPSLSQRSASDLARAKHAVAGQRIVR